MKTTDTPTPIMDGIQMEIQTLMRDGRHTSAFKRLSDTGYKLERELTDAQETNFGHWDAIAMAFDVPRGHFKHMLEVVEAVEKLRAALVAAQEDSKMLEQLDKVYLQYVETNHQAIWGGSWEREHAAQRAMKPIVNEMFDLLLKLLAARSAIRSAMNQGKDKE